MSHAFPTHAEARAFAAEARRIYRGTCWTVRVERPLFAGDAYRVVVV